MDSSPEAMVVDPTTEELLSPLLNCKRLAKTGSSLSSEAEQCLRLLPTEDPAGVSLALPDTLENLMSDETWLPLCKLGCFPFAGPLDPPTEREAARMPAGPALTLPLVVQTR